MVVIKYSKAFVHHTADIALHKNALYTKHLSRIRFVFGSESIPPEELATLGNALDDVVVGSGNSVTVEFGFQRMSTTGMILQQLCGKTNRIGNLHIRLLQVFGGIAWDDLAASHLIEFMGASTTLTRVDLGRITRLMPNLIYELVHHPTLSNVRWSTLDIRREDRSVMDGFIASFININSSSGGRVRTLDIEYGVFVNDVLPTVVHTALYQESCLTEFRIDVGRLELPQIVVDGIESIVANNASFKWLYKSNMTLASVGDEHTFDNNGMLSRALMINRISPTFFTDKLSQRRWKVKAKLFILFPNILDDWIHNMANDVDVNDVMNYNILRHKLCWTMGLLTEGHGTADDAMENWDIRAMSVGYLYTLVQTYGIGELVPTNNNR